VPTRSAVEVAAVQRRAVGVLSGVQVLGGLGVAAGVAVGGLIAVGVSGTESVAGLAQTSSVTGTAVAALPLAHLTERAGRRVGLAAGLLVGALGAAVVLVAATLRSLPMLLVGTFLFGAATASGLQARYAATDLAQPDHRARAMSTVVWATTVGAVAGPNLADPAGRVAMRLGLPQLSGAYLFSFVAFLLAAVLVGTALRPDPLLLARARSAVAGIAHSTRRPLRDTLGLIRATPAARVGVAAIAVGHTAMVSVMVMTPVHMRHMDVALTVIGLVVSVHILGMYALSPLVGWAVDRLGRRPVLLGAVGLLLAAAAIAGTAPADDARRLGLGLFLLGVGWSGTLIAGSTLLSESVPADARVDVQGASDLVMYGCGALGGAMAGVVVGLGSYGLLTLLTGVLVLGLLWLVVHTRGVSDGFEQTFDVSS
jgi:MFS family permease